MDLRLEGFDTPLRGHRFAVIGDSGACLGRLAVLESESLYKGRSVLVIQESGATSGRTGRAVPPAIFRRRWDCVFRIRESFEAQMLATYVANAPKPVRIMWISLGQMEIPRALSQRWQKTDVTLIGVAGLSDNLGTCEWEAILFPLRCPQETIERVLGSRGSGIVQMFMKIKEHMGEIAANGAGLVWTNIGETEPKGCLYWYDPSEGSSRDGFTRAEAAALLEDLSKWVGSGSEGK